MKTYSHSDWMLAQDAWIEGEFSPEWKIWRHRAAMDCGIIFPPNGDRYDSWEDDAPTQRAILIRAIRETPDLLRQSMKGASSWSQVIDRLMRRRDDWRAEMRAQDRPDDDRVIDRGAAMTIKQIMERIGSS